jgi:hypothetical protein
MMFPLEEVCGGKGLVDKHLSSSLYVLPGHSTLGLEPPSGASAG